MFGTSHHSVQAEIVYSLVYNSTEGHFFKMEPCLVNYRLIERVFFSFGCAVIKAFWI